MKRPQDESLIHLSDEQQVALEMCQSGENIFLTGGAGSGKSFVVREFMKDKDDKEMPILASTGAAAVLLGGRTFHSFFGLGIMEGGASATFQRIINDKKTLLGNGRWRQWRRRCNGHINCDGRIARAIGDAIDAILFFRCYDNFVFARFRVTLLFQCLPLTICAELAVVLRAITPTHYAKAIHARADIYAVELEWGEFECANFGVSKLGRNDCWGC